MSSTKQSVFFCAMRAVRIQPPTTSSSPTAALPFAMSLFNTTRPCIPNASCSGWLAALLKPPDAVDVATVGVTCVAGVADGGALAYIPSEGTNGVIIYVLRWWGREGGREGGAE